MERGRERGRREEGKERRKEDRGWRKSMFAQNCWHGQQQHLFSEPQAEAVAAEIPCSCRLEGNLDFPIRVRHSVCTARNRK